MVAKHECLMSVWHPYIPLSLVQTNSTSAEWLLEIVYLRVFPVVSLSYALFHGSSSRPVNLALNCLNYWLYTGEDLMRLSLNFTQLPSSFPPSDSLSVRCLTHCVALKPALLECLHFGSPLSTVIVHELLIDISTAWVFSEPKNAKTFTISRL